MALYYDLFSILQKSVEKTCNSTMTLFWKKGQYWQTFLKKRAPPLRPS